MQRLSYEQNLLLGIEYPFKVKSKINDQTFLFNIMFVTSIVAYLPKRANSVGLSELSKQRHRTDSVFHSFRLLPELALLADIGLNDQNLIINQIPEEFFFMKTFDGHQNCAFRGNASTILSFLTYTRHMHRT